MANEGGLYRSADGGAPGVARHRPGRGRGRPRWPTTGRGCSAGAGARTVGYEGGQVWSLGRGDPAVAAGGELVEAGAVGLVVSGDAGATWTRAPARGPGSRDRPGRRRAGPAPRRTAEGQLLLERARAVGRRGWPSPRSAGWPGWPSTRGGRGSPGRAWTGLGGGGVWRSEDDSGTWTDRSGGAAEVPAGAVVPDPERPGTVFAATDAGVWRVPGTTRARWRPLRGLPNAPALALALPVPASAWSGPGCWGGASGSSPWTRRPGPVAATPGAALRPLPRRPSPPGAVVGVPRHQGRGPPAAPGGAGVAGRVRGRPLAGHGHPPGRARRVTPGYPARAPRRQVHHPQRRPPPRRPRPGPGRPACLRPPDVPPAPGSPPPPTPTRVPLAPGRPPPRSGRPPPGPVRRRPTLDCGPHRPTTGTSACSPWLPPPGRQGAARPRKGRRGKRRPGKGRRLRGAVDSRSAPPPAGGLPSR